ncbi:hypothetical protein QW180_30980 [Vibrio sinaloensis]|nr:hypothetical protein [Vibrio sinaloensis]
MSFLAPFSSQPIAIADKLKIEDFLLLKGIQVTEIERQPAQYKDWLIIANRWVNNLSRYAKGFRTLNYLAKKTADAAHHLTQALTLNQQNNLALRRLIDDLEEGALLHRDGEKA